MKMEKKVEGYTVSQGLWSREFIYPPVMMEQAAYTCVRIKRNANPHDYHCILFTNLNPQQITISTNFTTNSPSPTEEENYVKGQRGMSHKYRLLNDYRAFDSGSYPNFSQLP